MQKETPPKSPAGGYGGPEPGPNPRTKRVARAFIYTASTVLIVNIGIAITIGTLSDRALAAFAFVNLPALPCVFGMAVLSGPAPGDASLTPFERSIPTLLALFGSVLWGLIAASFAKAKAPQPGE